MKLRRLELLQVRKFEGAVAVAGLADGVNLVCGANEAGKSTLLAALRVALFIKHTSDAATVRALRHHRHATAPEIRLELELDGGPVVLEKRYLQRPRANLSRADGVRFEGEAAEIEFRRMLGDTGGASGLWNLLLVDQGGAVDAALPGDARSVLHASLQAIFGAGGEVSAADLIDRLDRRLAELVTPSRGEPRNAYRDAVRARAKVEDELASSRASLDDNRADLDELEATLERKAPNRTDDERALEQTINGLELRRRVATAQRAGRLREEALRLRLGQRRWTQTALDAAAGERVRAELAAEQARAARGDLESRGSAARRARDQANAGLEKAQGRLGAARALGALARERHDLEDLIRSEAAELVLDLTPEGVAAVRIDGQPAASARLRLRVRAGLAVDLGELGRLDVRPPPGRLARLAARVGEVESAAAEHLRALGLEVRLLGVDRAALAGLVRETDEGVNAARRSLDTADRQLEEVRSDWKAIESELRQHTAAAASAAGREEELASSLAAERADASDEALEQALRDASAEARSSNEATADQDDDLDALEERIHEARRALAGLQRERHAHERQIDRLRTRIETRAAAGLREEVGRREEEEAQLRAETGRFAREVAVMRLLRDTLEQADREIRDRYLEPLTHRLRGYLDLLLPGIKIELDESMAIRTVARGGPDEPYEQLSYGTREQIAVAVRLAFAEVLIDAGRPCFVVLDDALVFSDDDRLERMFEILERAGRKVQILVLTCREQAFRKLRAKRLRIESPEEAAAG